MCIVMPVPKELTHKDSEFSDHLLASFLLSQWFLILVAEQFPCDKGNFVVLINSSILGKNSDPNELVYLTCAFIAKQR